jgi:hypothetical protein
MVDEMAGDCSYVQLLSNASKDEKKSPPEVNGMKDGLFNDGLVSGCNWSLFPWLPLVYLDDRTKFELPSLLLVSSIRWQKHGLIVLLFSSSAIIPMMMITGCME